MIVVIKNYKKDKNCFWSARSIRHLFPSMPIYLFSFSPVDPYYKGVYTDTIEYETKYPGSGNGIMTLRNGLYFGEGINEIFKYFINYAPDEKLLILDEDSFFLTGEVIRELLENDFALGWCNWILPDGSQGVGAQTICIVPSRVREYVPIPEREEFIESVLRDELLNKLPKKECYQITNRNHTNYFGDGFFTRSADEIRTVLQANGFI